jgi:hypothetical protein
MTPHHPETDALHRQLGELTDRAAITTLLDRFVLGLDDPDPASRDEDWYRSLFTEDVRLDMPNGRHRGIVGLVEFQRGPAQLWHRTQHLATSCVTDLHGDTAVSTANVQATHVPHDTSGELFTGGARYHFDSERTAAGWRIGRLTVRVIWHTGQRETA